RIHVRQRDRTLTGLADTASCGTPAPAESATSPLRRGGKRGCGWSRQTRSHSARTRCPLCRGGAVREARLPFHAAEIRDQRKHLIVCAAHKSERAESAISDIALQRHGRRRCACQLHLPQKLKAGLLHAGWIDLRIASHPE